jgi:hypothetical protein
MKRFIALRPIVFAFAVSILLPVNSSVKQSFSNRFAPVYVAVVSGSPVPIPTPPGLTVSNSSGSPVPIPTPPGRVS